MIYSLFLLNIKSKKIQVVPENLNDVDRGIAQFTKLKDKNPQLKMLLQFQTKLDIWDSTHLEFMTNSTHIDAVVGNVVLFLKTYMFDGIVLQLTPLDKQKSGFKNLITAIKINFSRFGYLLVVPDSSTERLINDGRHI